jgi:hypothetical protein
MSAVESDGLPKKRQPKQQREQSLVLVSCRVPPSFQALIDEKCLSENTTRSYWVAKALYAALDVPFGQSAGSEIQFPTIPGGESAMPRNNAVRRYAPDVFLAFRDLVYEHGVDRLAPLMGLARDTLYNKADAGDENHNQPTLRDVLLATQATGDMRVLDALNETFGRAAYDCASLERTSDEALLELLTSLGAESGEFHLALAKGLKERRFSVETMRDIRAQAFDMVSALMVLVKRLEGYVDADD